MPFKYDAATSEAVLSPQPVRVAYDALIAAHELKPDSAQERAVAALDRLAASFDAGRFFARLFGSRNDGPAGVYLWGGVGRGKSMLMDLAFEQIPAEPKRRVHFHEFMLETHARLRVHGNARKATRSSRWPNRSRKKQGCCASTRCRSPIRPTR